MGEKTTRHMWCDVCELGTGPVLNDIAEDEDDTELPSGWVVIEARRVHPNPGFMDAYNERSKAIEQHMANRVNAAMALGGSELEETQISALREAARAEAEIAVGEVEAEKFMVQYVTGHLCPEHAVKLQALDIETFGGDDE
tara:strand:- start:64 stop:486 length:423 start_codon:yes stop_codon:yes gene_type:complete